MDPAAPAEPSWQPNTRQNPFWKQRQPVMIRFKYSAHEKTLQQPLSARGWMSIVKEWKIV